MRKRASKPSSAIAGKTSEKGNGCRPGFSGTPKTLAGLVAEYEEFQKYAEKGWNPLRSLMEGYRGLADPETAIKSAAIAEDLVGKSYRNEENFRVKRHGHQRRIKRAVLDNARRVLVSKPNIEKLKSCRSFEEIFDFVSRNCERIPGLGPLYVYDTALRIGAFSKKLPKQVYLQAGALSGARALGLDVKKSPLPAGGFPKVMQCLAPHEVEDFLCIYKDALAKIEI